MIRFIEYVFVATYLVFVAAPSSSLAQGEQVPLLFRNNTSGTFTCVAANGQIFTLTERQNREYTTIAPNKTVPVVLVTLGNGNITWVDKTNNTTVQFFIEHRNPGPHQFKVNSSPGFRCQLSYANISGVRVTQIEISDQSRLAPERPIEVDISGNAILISMMRINISETGMPRQDSWTTAFDFSVSVPSKFQPSSKGEWTYRGNKGQFTGYRLIDPVLEWSFRMSTDNRGDSICDVFVQAKGLPNGVPLTVQFQPLRPDQWVPGIRRTETEIPRGSYYKVYAIEEDPGSPFIGKENSFGRYAFFHCEGLLWKDKMIPAEIVNLKNFQQFIPIHPGVLELKNLALRQKINSTVPLNNKQAIARPSGKIPLTKSAKQ